MGGPPSPYRAHRCRFHPDRREPYLRLNSVNVFVHDQQRRIDDAEGRRVEKVLVSGFGTPQATTTVEDEYLLGLDGEQVAVLGAAGNWLWTNVYAGGNALATYDNTGTHFTLADWLGTKRMELNVTGPSAVSAGEQCQSLPYGDGLNCSGSDVNHLHYTGKQRDTESTNDYFNARYYASNIAARFLTPDPYNGSYDPNNPQSFNRYMYVNGNPLEFTDPSGLAGAGVLTGIGGNLCLGAGPGPAGAKFNFCDPLISAISVGLFGTSAYVPFFSFAVTLGCSFAPSSDTTSSLCGQSGWTSAVFTGNDKWVGTAINDAVATVGLVDALAIPGAAAAAGYTSSFAYLTSCITGPTDPVCDVAIALVVYTALNDLFSVFWDLFGGSGPQFTGSLLPRPSDLGGLGTAPIGIPNQNLSITGILGQPAHSSVSSP